MAILFFVFFIYYLLNILISNCFKNNNNIIIKQNRLTLLTFWVYLTPTNKVDVFKTNKKSTLASNKDNENNVEQGIHIGQ